MAADAYAFGLHSTGAPVAASAVPKFFQMERWWRWPWDAVVWAAWLVIVPRGLHRIGAGVTMNSLLCLGDGQVTLHLASPRPVEGDG